MQIISTQSNQQLSRYVFSKGIKYLEKSNTRINTEHIKNKQYKIQKTIEYKANE